MTTHRIPCPVEGCGKDFALAGTSYRQHCRGPHTRCGCGWLGMSINQHISIRRRLGYDISGCYGAGPVQTTAAEAMAAVRLWQDFECLR